MSESIRFCYFGGEPLGVPVLEELKAAGYVPSLVVTSPDRKAGRGQTLMPPPVKVWAESQDIPVWQPEGFSDREVVTRKLADFDLFIVVAYNHILPEWLIELPTHNSLNVHPSLLPLLRGASPIRSAILKDMREQIGVSVMVLDAKMDHGPIIAQDRLEIAPEEWPVRGPALDTTLAQQGGRLLAASLPGYLSGDLVPCEQEHEYATYCSRFTKDDGALELDPHNLPTGADAYQLLLRIYALMGNPSTYFMHREDRIKINDAAVDDTGQLQLITVTPAGKPAQEFTVWLNNTT